MTNQHPITVPPELVQQWIGDYYGCPVSGELAGVETAIATRAAQWGADQELEACIDWLANARNHTLNWNEATNYSANLRAARRPKPPSLKEQAHEAYWNLRRGSGADRDENQDWDTIRRALEQLPE